MKLRKATPGDWDYILYLRNSSFKYLKTQTNAIEKKDHYSYLEKMTKKDDFFQYIYDGCVLVTLNENDVGVICDPDKRNNQMAFNALLAVFKLHDYTKYFANIRMDNAASFKLFTKACLALQNLGS